MKLEGSKTEANLIAALAGESQASVKYQLYAEKARQDGYEEMAQIFETTARNEKAHAQQWYEYLHGGQMADTKENLKLAASGEHYEWSDMYPSFAKVAKEEGFTEIAKKMEMIASIEKEFQQVDMDVLVLPVNQKNTRDPGDRLCQNSCNGNTRNSPAERDDKPKVQHYVQHTGNRQQEQRRPAVAQ